MKDTAQGPHSFGRMKWFEIETEGNHRDALGRRDTQGDQVVADFVGDGHQPGRAARQDSLDGNKHGGAPPSEVPGQNVSMECVDPNWRPSRAEQQRGGATDGAGLRRMRVQDRRPHPCKQPGGLDHRAEIMGPERSPERIQSQRHDAKIVSKMIHRALLRSLPASHQHRRVPSLPEPLRQRECLDRRASDVQPPDHPNDAQRRSSTIAFGRRHARGGSIAGHSG